MKQRKKNILAIILIIIVLSELLIYKSKLNFAHFNIYSIILLNLIVCIGFIFWNSRKLEIRILLTLITIGIGLLIFFFEFVHDFSQTENKYNTWKINEYEIIYAGQEYFAGPGSSPYLKLRKNYVFGLFYKDIDKIEPNSTFVKLGKTDCIVDFIITKTEFDLCKKKQLK